MEATQNARPAETKLILAGHGVAAFHGANVPMTNSTNANTSRMVVSMGKPPDDNSTPKPDDETVQNDTPVPENYKTDKPANLAQLIEELAKKRTKC